MVGIEDKKDILFCVVNHVYEDRLMNPFYDSFYR